MAPIDRPYQSIENHGRVIVVGRPRSLDEACLCRNPQRGSVINVNRTAHDFAREVSVMECKHGEHGFRCVAAALDEWRHDPAHLELADRWHDVSLEVRDADLSNIPTSRAFDHGKDSVARKCPVTDVALHTLPRLLARQRTSTDEPDQLWVLPQRRHCSQIGGHRHP
jgi:hypothetical protein